ncbi:MAG TPA: hypothetical protein VMQ50_15890, partial [Casimicrobiaceae bacterium]|nr:hypothetical protein [Casimicrobiaceae bacterium]
MRTLAKQRLSSQISRLLFAVVLAVGMAPASQGAVFVSVAIAPPPIPVYTQPICPGPGYIWAPGYWAWDPVSGYYWVPGAWVIAPFVGALWTPGYWGWANGAYVWHAGYWGTHVGFYGGINYGFGYFGVGYSGGNWRGNTFYYNTSVTHVNVRTVNNYVYTQQVTRATTSRVAFNGGPGGISRQPTAQERVAQRDQRSGPTSVQQEQERVARSDRSQLASVNHGNPGVMATPRAGTLAGGSTNERAAPPRAATSTPTQREPRAEVSRPETRAQVSRPETRAQIKPPETRAQATPRPEVHARAAPQPQMRASRPEPQ